MKKGADIEGKTEVGPVAAARICSAAPIIHRLLTVHLRMHLKMSGPFTSRHTYHTPSCPLNLCLAALPLLSLISGNEASEQPTTCRFPRFFPSPFKHRRPSLRHRRMARLLSTLRRVVACYKSSTSFLPWMSTSTSRMIGCPSPLRYLMARHTRAEQPTTCLSPSAIAQSHYQATRTHAQLAHRHPCACCPARPPLPACFPTANCRSCAVNDAAASCSLQQPAGCGRALGGEGR